jgi:hypothetical protein
MPDFSTSTLNVPRSTIGVRRSTFGERIKPVSLSNRSRSRHRYRSRFYQIPSQQPRSPRKQAINAPRGGLHPVGKIEHDDEDKNDHDFELIGVELRSANVERRTFPAYFQISW